MSLEREFDRVYQRRLWGGGSGPGSLPHTTSEYRKLVEGVLLEYEPKTVVDCGCGDWRMASLIDWGNVEYLGVDVSKVALKKARKRAPKSFQFECRNVVETETTADLALVKDVLQHLSFEDVKKFLNNLRGCKYVLITNDYPGRSDDVVSGVSHRPIDVTQPPIELPARLISKYRPEPEALEKAVFLWKP